MPNQIRHASVRLEVATAESRDVRVPDTSHLTQPTEIQNGLALANQQQNGGEVASTQIGHAPVRLEAQGQTAVQCTQSEIPQQKNNSSRAVLTQIGHMSPVGWKPRARQQFSTGKTKICSSRTVAGQFQLKSGMHPFGWQPRAKK